VGPGSHPRQVEQTGHPQDLQVDRAEHPCGERLRPGPEAPPGRLGRVHRDAREDLVGLRLLLQEGLDAQAGWWSTSCCSSSSLALGGATSLASRQIPTEPGSPSRPAACARSSTTSPTRPSVSSATGTRSSQSSSGRFRNRTASTSCKRRSDLPIRTPECFQPTWNVGRHRRIGVRPKPSIARCRPDWILRSSVASPDMAAGCVRLHFCSGRFGLFLERALRFSEPLKLLKPFVLFPRCVCRGLRCAQRLVRTVGSR
jgi:hypothetical protein